MTFNVLDSSAGLDLAINVKTNPQGIDKAKQDLRSVDAEFKKTINSMISEGRKLSMIGAEFDRIAKSILGPLTQAADAYAKKFNGVEAQATAFTHAQEKQQNATINLGRAVATDLIPNMNALADVTQRIANFATQNPALTSGIVNVAATTAVVGATLVGVGQVLSTMGRIQAIVSSGGLVGGIGTAIIGIGAFAVGLKGGEIAVNLLGKATGSAALEHFKLVDALKSVRELIGIAFLPLAQAFIQAKVTWGQLADIIAGVGFLLKNTFDDILDRLATGFRKAIDQLGGFLVGIYNGFIGMINGMIGAINDKLHTNIGTLGTVTDNSQAAINQEDFGLNARSDARAVDAAKFGDAMVKAEADRQAQYKIDQENLAKIAASFANFAKTGSLGPVADNIISTIKGIAGDMLNKAGLGKPSAQSFFVQSTTEAAGKSISPQIKITETEKKEELKLNQSHAIALQKQDIANAEAERKLLEQQQAKREQLIIDFNRNETAIEQKAEFDKLQRAFDSAARLNDFAASRNVAGFVSEMIKSRQDEQAQARQDDFDKQQRQKQFNDKLADEKKADIAALNQLHDQQRKQADILNAGYEDQIANLRRAKADQLAALNQHNTNVSSVMDAHHAHLIAATTAAVGRANAILNQLFENAHLPAGLTEGKSGGSTQDNSAVTTFNAQLGGYSSPAIPSSNFYSQQYQNSGPIAGTSAAAPIHVNVNAQFGAIATPQDVQAGVDLVMSAVSNAHTLSRTAI